MRQRPATAFFLAFFETRHELYYSSQHFNKEGIFE